MKLLFIIGLISLSILILSCIIYSKKNDDRIAKTVGNLMLFGFITIINYTMTIIIPNTKVAIIFQTLYFLDLDWLLYYLMSFCLDFTERKKFEFNLNKRKRFTTYIRLLCILDSLSIFLNLFFNHAYDSFVSYSEKGGFYYLSFNFKVPYFIHLGICYIIVLYIMLILIVSVTNKKRLYKNDYIVILSVFLSIIFINVLFMMMHWVLDYSVLLYGVLAVFICYYLYSIRNKNLKLLHKAYFESLNSAVFCFDYKKKCIYKNKKARSILSDNENIDSVAEKYLDIPVFKDMSSDLNYVSIEDIIIINNKKRDFIVEYQKLHDSKGVEIGGYLKFTDITEEVEEKNKERLRSTHDSLTGLYNKNGFFQKVKEIIERDPETPRYMVATNIENFKFINDVFGSELGDKILKEQAKMLSYAKYKDSVIGRIASDRFGLLINKKDFKMNLAEENTKRISDLTKSLNYSMKIHIGVYEISNYSEDIQMMYDKALMAIEKRAGNYEKTVTFYDTMIMDLKLIERNILNDFNGALELNHFDFDLQPIFDSKVNCVSAEALTRWYHPARGIMYPDEFIPILEKSGYITRLDIFIWEKAAALIKQWNIKGFENVSLSVNISPKDFYLTDLYEQLTKLVEKYRISAQSLMLEISEEALVNREKGIIETLQKLKKYGFKIEIDNFGRGNSCLNIINDINPDFIKIDINTLNINDLYNRTTILLGSIIDLSNKLGIGVTVARIETTKELEVLGKHKCDCFQGFYFAKPFKREEFDVNKYFVKKFWEEE